MRETVQIKEVDCEKNRLKNISERLSAAEEKFSVTEANQKLAERLDIGDSAEYLAGEKLDKKTIALKEEINELLAERYNTSPEFEELRSKSKLGRLSKLEKARYAVLSLQYPERAEISSAERRRTNLAYEEAKRYNVDFQIMDALRFYKAEKDSALRSGNALNPRESDLYDKLSEAYVKKINDHVDEVLDRGQALLQRM